MTGELFLDSFFFWISGHCCSLKLCCSFGIFSLESSISAHYGFDSQLISFKINQRISNSHPNTCREGLNAPEYLIIAHSRTPGVRIPVSVSSYSPCSFVTVSLAISSVH